MRHIVLVLLLLGTQPAHAQSLDLRGFGGLMMNSGTYQSTYNYERSKLNALGGIGASYRAGRFEYGLNLAYRRYSFQKMLRFADQFDPVTSLPLSGSGNFKTFTFKEPALALAPVVNYHFGNGRLDWYAGLSPAYVRYTMVVPTDRNFDLSKGINGFSIDAQMGCSYEVIPRLRIFGELSGGSVWIPYFMAEQTRFYNAALNLGGQFRLWERRPGTAASQAE